MTDPIDILLADLARAAGPSARLHRIAEARLEVERIEQRFAAIRADVIREARDGLLTWRQIGDVLGVSLQRAHELGNLPTTEATERTRT